MSEEKKIVIRCRAIIVHEGKVLAVRHTRDSSFMALPGGHLEWGEHVQECLSREIVEELGVRPEIGRLLYINTFTDSRQAHSVEFFFEVLNGKDYLDTENKERSHAHELFEMRWVSPNDAVEILPQKFAEDFRKGLVQSDQVRYI